MLFLQSFQFEKEEQVYSIDIGNEGSAFIEVLVGHSTSVKDQDYEVCHPLTVYCSTCIPRRYLPHWMHWVKVLVSASYYGQCIVVALLPLGIVFCLIPKRTSHCVSQVLLVTSSFMSPMESHNGTNTNRVRFFGPSLLVKAHAQEKWDRVKIVCSQPYNKVSCTPLRENFSGQRALGVYVMPPKSL